MSRLPHSLAMFSLMLLAGRAAAQLPPANDALPRGAILRMGSARMWHETWLTDLTFSPNDQILAAADSHGTIRFWEIETGRLAWELPKKSGAQVAFSPDGKWLATGGYYQTEITLWDVARREQVRRWPQNARSLAFLSGGKRLAAGGSDGVVRLWNTETGELAREYKGHSGALFAVAVSPDGKLIASGGGGDGTSPQANEVRLWDAESDREVGRLEEDEGEGDRQRLKGWIYSLSFSADGKRLAVASPYAVRIWDVERKKQLHRLEHCSYDVAFSPIADRLVVPGDFGVFDPATGKQVIKLGGDVGVYGRVAYSRSGALIASGSKSGRVQLWNAATGKEIVRRSGHDLGVRAVAFSPDGAVAASLSREDGTLRLWGTASGKQLRKLDVQWAGPDVWWSAEGSGLLFPPSGREAGTWTYDGTVRLWELAGSGNRTLQVGKRSITNLAMSRDGNMLAVVEYDGSRPDLGLYETDGGTRLKGLNPFGKSSSSDPWISCLVFSPDGGTLALGLRTERREGSPREKGGSSTTIQIWDVAKGELVRDFRQDENAPVGLVFTPNGKWLASAATGKTPLQLWDVAEGTEVRRFAEKDIRRSWYEGAPLAISPDGKLLAAAQNTEIVLWELATGVEVRRLSGHAKTVSCLAFSPDSKTLLSGSQDTTLILWNIGGDAAALPVQSGRPDAKQLEAIWRDLGSLEGDEVRQAVGSLVAASDLAAEFLRGRLKPLPDVDPAQFPQLVADLRHPDRARREIAVKFLKHSGVKASPALYKALQNKPSAELRQEIEAVLEVIGEFPVSSDRLREQRAILVLERIGTPTAELALQSLVGAQGAVEISREAQAALERLKQRAKVPATKIVPENQP